MKTIGRYEIQSVISESGVGRVYAALDETLNCSVAIKVLLVGNSVDRDRLLSSLRTATISGITHPGIAKVYGCGEHDGRLPYIVMEYLAGKTLEARIRDRQSLDLFESLSLMVQLAEALSYAHQRGAIHGKLNPENVFVLDDGSAKILNLGITGVLRDSSGKRNDLGRLIDELAYQAPEQFQDDGVNGLCDIFSYGVVSYELVTGKHPFRSAGSKNMGKLLRSVTTLNPPELRTVIPDCPWALEKVIQRAMEKKPGDRYPAFDDLLMDLKPIFLDFQSESAMREGRQAEELLAKGKSEEARTAVLKALRADPQSESLNTLRKKIQQRFETPTTRESRERFLNIGRRALASGSFLEAAGAFESAVNIDPLEVEALHLLRRAQGLHANKERATGLFKLAKQAAEKHDWLSGSQLMEQGLTATIEVFSGAQILYPSAQEIHGLMELFRKNTGSI